MNIDQKLQLEQQWRDSEDFARDDNSLIVGVYASGAFGEASSKQVREAMYLQLYRSKLQFFRKFGGADRARQAKALLALVYAPRVVFASTAALVAPAWRPRARTWRRLLTQLPTM